MTLAAHERAIWLARNALPHEPALRAWLARRPLAGLEVDDIVQETYAILAALCARTTVATPLQRTVRRRGGDRFRSRSAQPRKTTMKIFANSREFLQIGHNATDCREHIMIYTAPDNAPHSKQANLF